VFPLRYELNFLYVYLKRNSVYKYLKLKSVATRNKTFCAICIPFHVISMCTYLSKTTYTVLLNLATYFYLRANHRSTIHKKYFNHLLLHNSVHTGIQCKINLHCTLGYDNLNSCRWGTKDSREFSASFFKF
jgi:hypothetical protein